MTIREFALALLQECGCKLDCYKGNDAKYALPDLQQAAKERDIPFPLEDVANALIEIGNEQPDPPRKGHKQFCMIFDVGHTVDGVEFDTFEEARNDAIYTLENWIIEELVEWKPELDANGIPMKYKPTRAQIEAWDRMINTCSVCVVEWNDELGDWEDPDDGWCPSYEEEEELNWMEWEGLKKKYGW